MKQAARAIIVRDDKLLVMKRNKYGDIYYVLVGGGVDPGETPERAVVREVAEESSLDLKKYKKYLSSRLGIDLAKSIFIGVKIPAGRLR